MLFYYTATGNCLYVARKLDKELYSIPQVLKKKDLYYQSNSIGIVAPIYAGELPQTVKKFLSEVHFDTPYFFMILTYGSRDTVAGVWCEKFCQEQGLHVDFIQTIKMVDNYLPSFDMDEQMVIDKHVDKQIQKVKEQLQIRSKGIPQPTQEDQDIYKMVKKRFHKHPELNNGEAIQITQQCVGCQICLQVCPTGNIQIVEQQAQRISQTCDFCLACVHHCPLRAIRLKIEKNPQARYRHPKVSLKDIVKSNYQGGIIK